VVLFLARAIRMVLFLARAIRMVLFLARAIRMVLFLARAIQMVLFLARAIRMVLFLARAIQMCPHPLPHLVCQSFVIFCSTTFHYCVYYYILQNCNVIMLLRP
jgi:hypothetical protein